MEPEPRFEAVTRELMRDIDEYFAVLDESGGTEAARDKPFGWES